MLLFSVLLVLWILQLSLNYGYWQRTETRILYRNLLYIQHILYYIYTILANLEKNNIITLIITLNFINTS